MPAASQSQAHYMQMARAVKHGHTLKGVRKGTMARLKKTAASMEEQQLKDFSHVATKKR